MSTLADFALIRRWRATFPLKGEGLGWVRLLKNYLPSKATLCRKIGAVSKSHGTAAAAFPRVGKMSRQRRMRAKSASGITVMSVLRAFPRVGQVARQCRMRAKQASVQHNAMHPTITTP